MPTVTFTSSGNWTALATTVDLQAWGEGGNGSTSAHGSHGGGGGGGGEYAEETALALTLSHNYSFTIGAGGIGTNTVFAGDSVTVTAHFGASSAGGGGGAGGSGSTNSIHNNGGAGDNGVNGSGNVGGGGGGGSGGAGGAGGAGSNSGGGAGPGGTAGAGSPGGAVGGNGGSSANPGSNGNVPGSGGGGGGATSTVSHAGGAGASGQITIVYTTAVAGTATLAGVGTLTAMGSSFNPNIIPGPPAQPGATWLRRFARWRHPVPWGPQIQTVTGTATLPGVGTLTAYGALPNPVVVNQWANSYGQGTTFTSITSALQSCVVGLNASFSVGPGSGTPTAGNWLFTIASWTQDPSIISVHVGVGDDGHSWWREFPAAGPSGLTRTSVSYTPNITSFVDTVYVAPDGEIAAINVLVVEIAGLGPWDTVSGTNVNYAAAATSLSLSLGAPAGASFLIAGVGGDNIASGQAFLPSGWQALATQTQGNGSNHLADNILTAAFLPSTTGSVSVSGTASSENLSGFLLSVKVSGNSPVPATQNPNWPYMVFEAGFGAGFNTPDSEITWTDLTTRMWDWEETTGIQFQLGQVQATDLTMHLDDLDGALIPTNTSSPYYPNVQPGTPVRLRGAIGTMGGVSVNRWYVIQRNATQWGEQIDEVFRRWCPVSGSDLWAALSSVPPTFYRSEVYEDAPYAWWPCDDQPGTAGVLPTFLLNAALGNTNQLNILLSPNGGALQQYSGTGGQSASGFIPPGLATYTVGANAGWMYGDPQSTVASIEAGNSATATPGSASWQASGQAGATGSFGWYLSCNDTNFPPLSGGITVEVWFNAAFYGSAIGIGTGTTVTGTSLYVVNYVPATQQPYNNQITILELATASAPVAVLQLDSSGHLDLITYNGGTGTSHSIYTTSDLRSSSWHMVTMTLTTSAWEVWLDGGANAHASGSGAGMTSAWTWLIGNADMGSGGGVNTSQIENGGNIALSHIAVYPYVLPYYRVLDHYWAAVTAFGQLPAPSGVQVQWVVNNLESGSPPGPNVPIGSATAYAPDGTPLSGGGYPGRSGVSASAIVVATAPGGIVSGISAQATGVDGGQFVVVDITPTWNSFYLWITWTGVAPSFNVYTGNTTGTDNEAAVVNGDGISFASGYGATASVTGVNKVSGGDGSAPPTSASAVGDTVGQRIERLMRAGRASSPNRCIDPAPLLVQAPGATGGGQQVGAAIQAIQESDSGLLFVDNQNNLTYWQRPHLAAQYSTPVWQLGPTSPRIPYYPEIEWVSDPQHVYNAITVAPLSPSGASLPLLTPSDVTDVEASQVRYGAQPLQVTSWLQSASEQQNQANWLFSVYGTPRRHAEKVKIDASGATPATLAASWEIVMGINCADVVQLEDWQVGGGGTVYTYRVTQVERHIEMGSGDNPATTGSVTLILDYEPTSYWT